MYFQLCVFVVDVMFAYNGPRDVRAYVLKVIHQGAEPEAKS